LSGNKAEEDETSHSEGYDYFLFGKEMIKRNLGEPPISTNIIKKAN